MRIGQVEHPPRSRHHDHGGRPDYSRRLQDKKADLIAVGREFIHNPNWAMGHRISASIQALAPCRRRWVTGWRSAHAAALAEIPPRGKRGSPPTVSRPSSRVARPPWLVLKRHEACCGAPHATPVFEFQPLQNMPYADLIKQIETRRPPAWDLLGVGGVAYDQVQDRVVIEWHAEARHCHSVEGHAKGGIVQGGIVTGWLDAAMASACLLRGEYRIVVASLEIKVAFLLPAHPGLYRAYGTVIRQGSSVGFLEAELRDANDALIATASSTAALRVREPSKT
jgi:acyl-CoA thioesterase